jgi:hypothetical protein
MQLRVKCRWVRLPYTLARQGKSGRVHFHGGRSIILYDE